MSQNGAPKLADLIPALSREIKEKQEYIAELETQLGEAQSEYHDWKKVLLKLDASALPQEEPKSQRRKRTRGRRTEPRMSSERYAEFRDTLLEYAKDHEEFRQVDVRSVTHIDSSALTESFERLRQDGIIRLARREGNSKWFRLTPAALRSMA